MVTPEPVIRFDALLARARAGDAAAREELARRCTGPLRARIRLMMGEQAYVVAESCDFLQEAMLQFARASDRVDFADEAQFIRWLTAVARNLIRGRMRRKHEIAFDDFCRLSGVFEAANPSGTPSAELRTAEARDLVADVLLELPEDDRRVIEWRHFEDLPFKAIAARLGRSENAVQLLHSRALLKLGKGLRLRGIDSAT